MAENYHRRQPLSANIGCGESAYGESRKRLSSMASLAGGEMKSGGVAWRTALGSWRRRNVEEENVASIGGQRPVSAGGGEIEKVKWRQSPWLAAKENISAKASKGWLAAKSLASVIWRSKWRRGRIESEAGNRRRRHVARISALKAGLGGAQRGGWRMPNRPSAKNGGQYRRRLAMLAYASAWRKRHLIRLASYAAAWPGWRWQLASASANNISSASWRRLGNGGSGGG